MSVSEDRTNKFLNTMTDKLKKIGSALTGVATVATLHSYYMNLQDNTLKNLVETFRAENAALHKTVEQLSADTSLSAMRRAEYIKITEAKLDRLNQILDLLREGKKETASQMLAREQVDWARDADETLADLKKLVNDYKGSDSSSQFVDYFNTNFVEELRQAFNSYLDWFNSLPLTHQGAVAHILVSITIFLLLSSLVTVFYSDYLVKRLNIESNFPRLAKYISIRRTFQQYYFFLNTVGIVFFLFIVIALNSYILLNA